MRLGGYEIIERIGEGGMGTVYKAHQPSLGRYVAIKILPERLASDPQLRLRFVQEGLAIAKLRHPNIVAAFDFAEQEGVAYLVSEFVEGGTLADQLGAPLPLDYVVTVLAPIASALDYAHSRGIVHRDVKPSNILLARDGTPVLSDFGLAKIAAPSEGLTQTGALLGTFEYLAPEYVSGAPAGPLGDQYSLALIAYEMLVGRRPFREQTPLALVFAQQNTPPPRPSELGVKLPPCVEAAVLRGLAKAPAERYPNCAAFVRALETGAARAALPSRRVLVPSLLGAAVLFVGALALAGAPGDVPVEPSATPRPSEIVLPSPTVQPSPSVTVAPSATPTNLPTPRPTSTPTILPPTPPPPTPRPAPASLDSVSPPATLAAGSQGQCVVGYRNDGDATWAAGTETEVVLALSGTVAEEVRRWLPEIAPGAIAVQSPTTVAPSQIGFFQFTYTVPQGTESGAYAIPVRPVLGGTAIGLDTKCDVSVQ